MVAQLAPRERARYSVDAMRGSASTGLGLALLLSAAVLLLVACGGSAESGAKGTGGASHVSGGASAATGGAKPGAGGSTLAMGGWSSGGSSSGGSEEPDVDLGSAVAGAATMGHGSCEGRTLGELVGVVHAVHPELAEVREYYDPKSATIGAGASSTPFQPATAFG